MAGKMSSFFKVLMSDFTYQMRIPPDYVKNLDMRSLGKCAIRGPSGRWWTVEVVQRKNDFYFEDGWQDFAKYHCLEVRDFLVFDYDGKSNFSAKIYCSGSSEKDAGLSENNKDKPVSLVEKGIYLEPKVEVDELEPEICKDKCKKKVINSNIIACDCGLSRKKPCTGKKVEGNYLEPKVEVDELKPEIYKEKCKRKVIDSNITARDCGLSRKKPHTGKKVEGNYLEPKVEVDELEPEINKEKCKKKVIDSNIIAHGCRLSRKKPHIGKRVEGNHLQQVEVDKIEPEVYNEKCKKKVMNNKVARDYPLCGKKPHTDDEQKPPIVPLSFKPENSCFVVPWKNHRRYRMEIPMKIVREKGLLNKKSIVLEDVFGRSWPVKLAIECNRRLNITSGFADFCDGNKVKNGNTLLFEFVKPFVMKVHISRAKVHVSGARKGRKRIEVL